jgi:DNA uptake protein ComE-like DNA-binding protein
MNRPKTFERPFEEPFEGARRTGTLQARLWKELGVLGFVTIAMSAALFWLSGCNNAPKSDQELQQQAAQTTQQVKQDAQEAAANAKVAAAKAERKVDDIAAGVREGLNNGDKPAPGRPGVVNINAAGVDRLSGLPGISATRAQRIVDGRPYASPHDLVDKGIISEAEYQRISGRIVAQ